MNLIKNREPGDESIPRCLPADLAEAAVMTELRRVMRAPSITAQVIAHLAREDHAFAEAYVISTLLTFEDVWGQLFPAEQTRIVQLLVRRVWATKTETASRLRGRIESVLAWATVAGHRTGDNPARWKGNLDAILPKPGKVAKGSNHPAVALDDAAAWFAALGKRDGTAARALEFLAMCASRSGEVRGATWEEIDLDKALWTIPAARIKAKREHRVPLTAEAVALVKAMPRMEDSPYVFAAPRGGPLSDMSLSAVMRRMQEAEVKAGRPGWLDRVSGRPAVPHGLRSTFRDWAAERTEYPRDMAEIALAHNVGSEVERAYRRGDVIEKRRAMMAAWGRFLRGKAGAKVVKLGAR